MPETNYRKHCLIALILELSPFNISSTDSKVKSDLYSIINNTVEKVLNGCFHSNGCMLGFHPQTRKLEPLLRKQHRRQELFNSFHFNGRMFGFNPQTRKLEPLLRKQHRRQELLNSFHLNGHMLGRFHPQTRKLGPPFT